ncbi:MAG TPA: hypothetical protein VK570_16500, partial [Rubrivivax sp.]|nr:hypothetical protein [Rubrivivax sp.]
MATEQASPSTVTDAPQTASVTNATAAAAPASAPAGQPAEKSAEPVVSQARERIEPASSASPFEPAVA